MDNISILNTHNIVNEILDFLETRAHVLEHQRSYRGITEKKVRKFLRRRGNFFPIRYPTFQSLPNELHDVFRQAQTGKCWEVFFDLLPQAGDFVKRCKLVVAIPVGTNQSIDSTLYAYNFLHAVILVDNVAIFDPILMKEKLPAERKIVAYQGFALQSDYVKKMFVRPLSYSYLDLIRLFVRNYHNIDPERYKEIIMPYDHKKVISDPNFDMSVYLPK